MGKVAAHCRVQPFGYLLGRAEIGHAHIEAEMILLVELGRNFHVPLCRRRGIRPTVLTFSGCWRPPGYSEAADRKRALGQNVGVAVNAL